jgi:hypothetical protein
VRKWVPGSSRTLLYSYFSTQVKQTQRYSTRKRKKGSWLVDLRNREKELKFTRTPTMDSSLFFLLGL